MIFTSSQPNAHYRVCRLISAGGKWEIGISLYATGARLRMGRAGRPPAVLDFCMGRGAEYYAPIFCAVLGRLERLSEFSSEKEVDAMFPWAGARPDLALHLELLLNEAAIADSPVPGA